MTFLPRPAQQPRIPIWIGGGFPIPGPTARAARWDGSMLYGEGGARLTPRRRPGKCRSAAGGRPYDISVGVARDGDEAPERARLQALAEAGATWTAEYVPAADPDVMRASIDRGPLRASPAPDRG